ncbi:hypothetical protein SAMN05192561_1011075 [Halopenitus malekzadehii]|uniref:Uncharacterized protein n=1 Tax=Halopenitus malekzadehii TaxID=1267564 RepID=A0A1H6I800_9EURY|nr:DUF5805 domain-containing protein [Halopenitus malekzadehii]SEH43781.1 hypothetical protein SAMN05192561_1011075 [Halopenitus malekzadehii]
MSTDLDTDRTSVKTYVPTYQKTEWSEHAEELGMSRSEFVRTMVQAGRRGFTADLETESGTDEDPDDRGSNPGGDGLEERVLAVLDGSAVHSWDELREAVIDDLEERLDAVLEDLQDRGCVRYRGRDGGYVLVDE